MQNLRVIIIDDEASSRNSLRQKILLYCTGIEILAECESGEQGIEAIETKRPDIVLLDVEMPRMNGFTMLQHLNNRDFELIFTTAYDHYAIQAIRYSALDYLVKPVEITELKNAIEKARQRRIDRIPDQRLENLLQNLVDQKISQTRIALPSMEGLQFVETGHIISLEAESNYTIIHLENAPKITVSKTLKDFEELLPTSLFIRIHHSCIINKNHIRKYMRGEGGQVLMSNGSIVDVSRRKKEEFLRAIGY